MGHGIDFVDGCYSFCEGVQGGDFDSGEEPCFVFSMEKVKIEKWN